MSNLVIEAARLQNELKKIADQARALAMGLEIAAPGDRGLPNPGDGLPNKSKSVEYLYDFAQTLSDSVEQINQLFPQITAASKVDDNKGFAQSP